MFEKEYFTGRKISILLVSLLIIAGTIFYFAFDIESNTVSMGSSNGKSDVNSELTLSLLQDIQLKAAYTDERTIDMFALAKNNALAKIPASQGESIPEVNGMVLGNVEGSMMQEEDEFKKIGDTLVDYDITFRVDGVLSNTGTFADDFHFLNVEQFNQINAESDVLLVKFKDANTPRLFYLYDKNNAPPVNMELSEGNMNLFYKHTLNKKTYYPIIIGSKEAQMMKDEKLFETSGDTIDDFFDRNVIIAGVLKETNTGLDMMHVVEPDFFDKTTNTNGESIIDIRQYN